MKAQELLQSFLDYQEKQCKGCGTLRKGEDNHLLFYVTSKQVWYLLKLIKEETGKDFYYKSFGKEFSIVGEWANIAFDGFDFVSMSFEPTTYSKGYNLRLQVSNQAEKRKEKERNAQSAAEWTERMRKANQ